MAGSMVEETFAGAEFEVASYVRGHTPVLRLSGHLSRSGLAQVRAAVDNALSAGAACLVMDLRAARFDSTSVALLGLVRRYCSRWQATLVLASAPRAVRDVLRRARVTDLYRVYPTVEDAVGSTEQLARRTADRLPVSA